MLRLNRFYMLAGIAFLAVALVVSFQTSVQAVTISYTTDCANVGDTPIFGQMIDPSDYYCGDGVGYTDPKTAGNSLDRQRVYIWDWEYPSGTFQMMKWDMGSKTNFVRVYPDIENGFIYGYNNANGHDYLEWSLWGSNDPAEDSKAWTLLWDPINATGAGDVLTLAADTVNGSATSALVYRYGTNLDVGTVPGDAYSDAFTIDLTLPTSYRYFGIRTSTMALNSEDPDPEINAVASVSVMKVEIDIKPGSYPNSINLKSEGVIPVAILTTNDFDAASVDGTTVTFGPDGAKEVHGEGHLEDVNKDDRPDWVGHFKTQETGIKGSDTEAVINGKTKDGKYFTGKDSVNIVGGPKKAPALNSKHKLMTTWASIKSK